MSRQSASKRSKADQGLALPAQGSSGGGWARGTQLRGDPTYTPNRLALPSGGTSGYPHQQYAAQPQQDPATDPALQQAPAYPQQHSSLALPQPSQPTPSQYQHASHPQSQSYYPQQAYSQQQYQQHYQQQAAQQQAYQAYQQGYHPAPYQPYHQSQQQQQQPQQSQQPQHQQQRQQQAPAQPQPRGRKPAPPKPENDSLSNDALGSAGVDLRAEEDAIHRSYEVPQGAYVAHVNPRDDRSRKQTFMPLGALMKRMKTAAAAHNVTSVAEDAASYAALATQTHLSALLKAALTACKNRQPNTSGVTRPPGMYTDPTTSELLPMWAHEITRDVGKQIAALERVQRDNENQFRAAKRQREEAAASVAAAAETDEQPKKKRKKEGPGVAARNMSDEQQKRLSNAVAVRAAGGMSRYSWMEAGAAAGPIIPVKPRAPVDKPKTTTPATLPKKSTGWGRAYANVKEQEIKDTRRRVEVRDVITAMEGRAGSGIASGGTKGVGKGGKGGTKWRGWEAWSRVRE